MFEIGSSLRQARQHRGLALADVERETRVRAKYLGALEDERFDVLPGQAYVRGFLRTYAEFLGLDGNLYVAEYNEHHAEPEDDLPPIAHEPLGHATPAAGRAAARGRAARRHGRGRRRLAARLHDARDAAADDDAGDDPAGGDVEAGRRKAEAPRRSRPAKPGVLVIHATRGACWVAVRFDSAAGRTVTVRTLAQGETLRFGLDRKLWVRLGAPWNVDVTVRGKRVAPAATRRPVNLVAS